MTGGSRFYLSGQIEEEPVDHSGPVFVLKENLQGLAHVFPNVDHQEEAGKGEGSGLKRGGKVGFRVAKP